MLDDLEAYGEDGKPKDGKPEGENSAKAQPAETGGKAAGTPPAPADLASASTDAPASTGSPAPAGLADAIRKILAPK